MRELCTSLLVAVARPLAFAVLNAVFAALTWSLSCVYPDIVQFQDHYIQRYVSDYPDAFVPMEGADVDWDGFGPYLSCKMEAKKTFGRKKKNTETESDS